MITLYPHQQQILDALKFHDKGIISCPTGGGKTLSMITDSRRFLTPGNVVVVVAPQLLLCQQLFTEFDKHLPDVNFMYRQISSEGKIFQRDRKALKFRINPPKSPTTIVDEIRDTYRIAQKAQLPLVLFVTYDSLERIVSSMIPVSAVYYDEAHNATTSDHFNAVKYLSNHASNNYFFTATPRYSNSRSVDGPGMDNQSVYGEQIANVKFSNLVKQGVIVSPLIHLLKSDADLKTMDEVSVNLKTIKEVVDHYEAEHTHSNHKILFCTQGTKAINDLLAGGLQEWATSRGYKVLSIDSINQGYINGSKKISKSNFIDTLNKLGSDPNEKLIVLHYAMLGEGIDVKAFTGVVFLRNTLSTIFATQSMGRVIRTAPGKKYGIVTIVQHESNTNESQELIRNIVTQLISQGVPVSEIFTETSGRGKEEEIVEDINTEDLKRKIADYALQFEHNNILQELLMKDDEEFAF
jgi:superfamily II DNA or RNA helicase